MRCAILFEIMVLILENFIIKPYLLATVIVLDNF